MLSTLFAGVRSRFAEAKVGYIEIFIPKEGYFSDVPTEMRPSDVFPREAVRLDRRIGTKQERAVIATFLHTCIDTGDWWRGLPLNVLVARLHNEADRVENGQLGIRAASVSYFAWRRSNEVKRAKRLIAYHEGIALCLDRDLLRREVLDDKEVFFFTKKLIDLMLRPPATSDEKVAA